MSGEKPVILVTRPTGASESLVQQLRLKGFCPLELPCLSITSLPLCVTAKQVVMELDRYQFVIAVSVNAARYGLAWFEDFWPQWPIAQHWIGIGDKTRGFLESKGVPLLPMQLGATSESLIHSLRNIDWQDQRVLIVRGQGGREWLGDQLEGLGACVDYLECYCRTMPYGLFEAVHAFGVVPEVAVVTVSSGETLRHLSKACLPFKAWFDIPVVVPSERVAQMARELGWREIVVAESAYDEAIVAAVVDIFEC